MKYVHTFGTDRHNCQADVTLLFQYISSSELKTSEFSQVCSTSENFDVFNSRDEYIFDIYLEKVNLLFILYF